ncbi:hypothetical protein [Paraburkholderia bannensis]|uniref:hypothetical protein n=1 Tax=Paraburkholderia bannensis TaxID=765414 RepID=UPI002ABE1D5C|nr:hypothetical protein [Paraburkholderia bannensis]
MKIHVEMTKRVDERASERANEPVTAPCRMLAQTRAALAAFARFLALARAGAHVE